MPDPISSSCLPQDLSSNFEPVLDCEPDTAQPIAVTAAPPSANACIATKTEAQPDGASATQSLMSNYLRADHSKLLAAVAAPPTDAPPPSQMFFATKHGPGAQFQPELGASRTHLQGTLDGVHLSGTLDLLTAGVHAGVHNDDGSHGENLGASATLVGAEATAEYHGYSFTFGESVSLGGGFSSGEARDIDGDGVPERCFKASLGPLTFGFCDEL